MGNEQSSAKERTTREANIQATLQESLEKQRKIYEQTCKELLQTQADYLRKEKLGITSGRTTDGKSRDVQNNLYPNLQASTSREQPSSITYASPLSHQRYTVPSQSNDLLTNEPSANKAKRAIPSAPPMTSNQPITVNSVRNISRHSREINCPKCGNIFGATIFQCSKGHSSCGDCKMSGGICGVLNCYSIITDIRNRTLEAFMADLLLDMKKTTDTDRKPTASQQTGQFNIRLNCPNQRDGCCLHFTSNEMDNHLKECPYNEMACPLLALFGRCSWRGKSNQLDSHFTDCHPEHRLAQVDKEMAIVNTKDKKLFYLVLIGPYNFFVHVKIDSNSKMIYLAVQLVGTKVSASKWHYEFHIYNKAQPRRKFQYSDVCTSNTVPIDNIFVKKQCAAIPLAYIDTFFNRDILSYKFFLKKNTD